MFHVVFPSAPGSIAVVHGLEHCGEDCGESGPLSPTARRGTPEAIRDAFWMGKKKNSARFGCAKNMDQF